MFKLVTAVGLTLIIAGCSREAGNAVDAGTFGNATMNNQLVMRGELDYAVSLGRRFAAEIPTTVNFEFNSTVLDDQARSALDRQADWIRQFPEVRFKVYGHTDKVGSNGYNRRLGQRRANAVVRYLSQRGIQRSRLEALVSFGETRPIINTEARERLNRRTVTEVSGFVRRNPTVLDGKYAEIIYREYVESAEPLSGLSGRAGTGGFTERAQ
ncbi:MAG: OmpA family protein [Sedimentitalea sp.]